MIFVTKTKLPPISKYSKYLNRIWTNNWVTNNGIFVQELESKLKKYLGVNHLSLVTNATLALQLAIKSLKLTGEIITTPFTFAASTNVILWDNLTPVFADIDPNTFNINPDEIEKKITKKTSAILAVHVYGNPCDVVKIAKIAKKHHLKVIYDAAHAFGVNYKKSSILKYGDLSILSFHATKVFNTIEGGAIITKSPKLDKTIRLARNFGIVDEETVVFPGINAKMNEFQAAMGLCNLDAIDHDIKERKILYELYIRDLKKVSGLKFQKLLTSKYNYSYMPVIFRTKSHRDLIFNKLMAHKVHARKYFFPLTTDALYFDSPERIKLSKTLPIAKYISDRVLCLPLYSGLPIKEVRNITNIIIANS